MSAPDGDPTLRRAFAELRAVDRRSLPEFDALLPVHGRRSAFQFGPQSGIVVLVVVLAVFAAVLIARPPAHDAPVQSISEWRAPTDVLLQTPGVEVIRFVPSLRSSVIDRLGPQFNH